MISTSDIRQAVLQDQFRLLYQPQIEIASGRLVGVEALLRWEHPRHGLLAAGDFLDAIGTYGLWNRVTGWVLERAIADAAGWQAAGASIRVWVNVAASDVALHSALPQQVHRALADHGLSGDSLGLELTESGVLRNLDDAVSVLNALRETGVEIALDDFGTGFSSLTHLRWLPFSAVKIDRSFVRAIDASAPDAAITGAVIEVCRSLGVDSIVEGVERVAEWDVVARLGATQAQGFLLARPGPASHAPRWLETSWPAVIAERRRGEDSEVPIAVAPTNATTTATRNERLTVTLSSGTPLEDPRLAIWADRLTAPLDSAVAVVGSDGIFRYVSPTVTPLLGFEPHMLTGTSYLDLVHEHDLSDVRRSVRQFGLATQGAAGMSLAICRLRHRDGSWILGELTGASHPDDRTIDGIVVAMRRVTPAQESVVRNRRLRNLQDRLARGALGVSPEAFVANLGTSMRDLAAILDVDVAFVDEISQRAGTLGVLGGWDRINGVVSHPEGRQIPVTELPHWMRALGSNEIVVVENLATCSSPWLDELATHFGESERTGSIAVAVLYAIGYPIGTLGVKTDAAGRRYTPEEIAAMKSIAATIAQGIVRIRARQEDAPSDRFSHAIDDAGDLLCVTDLVGRLRHVSRASERLLGIPPQELVGMPLAHLIHPDDLERCTTTFVRLRSAGGQDVAENRLRHADGSWRWVESSVRLTSDGDAESMVFIIRDIADRIVERERDDHAQELEQLALQISQRALGHNALAGVAELSFFAKELSRLFDVELVFIEELEGSVMKSRGAYVPERSQTEIHPSFDLRDHPLLAKQLERREPFFYDDRLLEKGLWDGLIRDPKDNRSGALIPLVANGRLLGGLSLASSRPRSWSKAERTAIQLICGTLAAMFERRRLEDARHRVEDRFRTLADHAADIVTLCNSQGELVYVSPASLGMLGTPPDELVGLPAKNLFHPDDSAVVEVSTARLVAGEDVTFETRIAAADGGWVWAAVSSRMVELEDGRREFWGSVRDIGDRRGLELELQHRATHDPLTDLPNRSVFTSAMSSLAESRSLPASLVVIDLDDFKTVNDTHGHPAGDHVLIETAERMRALVRDSDVVARIGGDEFLVLCPNTSARDAAALVRRLREDLPLPIELACGGAVTVGCSIGMATAADVGELDRLLHDADAAMYRSKHLQRGRSALEAFS
ncbi:MAG: EAL domain-containing protein [Acidimicrobiia bacterium]